MGSFGHCVGMCGGIVLAYSSAKLDPLTPWLKQGFSHALYGAGRVTSYMLIGAFSGALGAVVAATPLQRGILFVLTGILMTLFGLSIAGRPNWLASIEYSVSGTKWFKELFGRLIRSSSLGSFYLLGVLNGFLPCGFVYFFAITAASTASLFYGAVVMGIFGLATIPALFLVGSLVGLIKSSSWRTLFMKFSALLVFLFGIYTAIKGYYLIVDPSGINTPALFGCTVC
ncbi:conserved hypothetical protein [Wolinella succinogenes]|uniref:Urease accessory protein UreH-like transmembrane domain-containing protein n=1 Tax=Wolinella succinogenes (strain ATCC 29543 / DSM 1740 / CCUG 13145 / JCM 31913 / LMG 7466 / NCTC 11488 / FDC 602W) TaxID=273121 RepID=Q7MS82_WOLSU|nr:conserved hypothetical protein [Wolinella succinogenes]